MMYPINYLDNQKKSILFSEDEDDFDFKYVPVDEFKNLIKNVKKKRTKEIVKKECILLAKQQIDRQTNLNNDRNNEKTENQFSKSPKFTERSQNKYAVQGKSAKNTLLSIPEEANPVTWSDCSKSKSTCRNSKKLPLEMAGESCYKFVRPQDSSTDLSPFSKNKDSVRRFQEIFLQPDLNATYQVLTIQRKIADLLDEISHRLNNVPLPDGESDFQRRQQRILEFSVRFSRNYLYDLSRQIADIRRHLSVILENEGVKFSKRGLIFHRQTVEHKLVAIHHLLLNALNVYCKHIPSSTLKGQPGKLKDILKMVMEVREICIKVNLTPEYMGFGDADELLMGKNTEEKCTNILSKLRLNSDNESQLMTQRANSFIPSLMNPKKVHQKRNPGNLYRSSKSVPLGRKRIRKSAGFYQKVKKQQSLQNMNSKNSNEEVSTAKSSSLNAIRTDLVKNNCMKIKIPPKEDEIKTMMDMIESDTDDESNTESQNPVTGIVISEPEKELMKKLSKTVSCKKNNKFTDEELLSAVPLISDLMSIVEEKKKKTVDQKASPKRKTKRSQHLICAEDLEKDVEQNDFSCQCPNESLQVKKDNRIELLVDKTSKNNLLKYKNEYESYLKTNPMYLSSTQNKPWEIVSWVAEKLVDELIAEVSKEFQIDDVIKRMFELEFQEF